MSGLIEFLRCRMLQGALRKGRPEAIDELFELMADPLYRLALAITRQAASAEEILQDVFMQLVRDPQRLREVRDVRAYLFRAVRNRSVDHARRGTREIALDGEWLEIPDARQASEGATVDALALRQALDALPDDLREVLILKTWEGLSFREIGEVLGIPLNTAASRHRYALGHLKKLLGEESRSVRVCTTTGS